jgi:hypothetical protein
MEALQPPRRERDAPCPTCGQETHQIYQFPECEWWCDRCGKMPSEYAPLNTQQAAAALGVTPQRIRVLIGERDAAGNPRLRAQKIGRDWLIAPADLDLVRDRPNGYPAGKPRKQG